MCFVCVYIHSKRPKILHCHIIGSLIFTFSVYICRRIASFYLKWGWGKLIQNILKYLDKQKKEKKKGQLLKIMKILSRRGGGGSLPIASHNINFTFNILFFTCFLKKVGGGHVNLIFIMFTI